MKIIYNYPIGMTWEMWFVVLSYAFVAFIYIWAALMVLSWYVRITYLELGLYLTWIFIYYILIPIICWIIAQLPIMDIIQFIEYNACMTAYTCNYCIQVAIAHSEISLFTIFNILLILVLILLALILLLIIRCGAPRYKIEQISNFTYNILILGIIPLLLTIIILCLLL
jgi:hypothetical protein